MAQVLVLYEKYRRGGVGAGLKRRQQRDAPQILEKCLDFSTTGQPL
jgi:hypothetical protein